MAHYHTSRGQQAKKWERFKQTHGMSPTEWRALKKSDPAKAEQVRQKAEMLSKNAIKVVKVQSS